MAYQCAQLAIAKYGTDIGIRRLVIILFAASVDQRLLFQLKK